MRFKLSGTRDNRIGRSHICLLFAFANQCSKLKNYCILVVGEGLIVQDRNIMPRSGKGWEGDPQVLFGAIASAGFSFHVGPSEVR